MSNDNVIWSDQVYRLFDIKLNTKVTYDIILDKIHPDDREYHNKLTEEWIKNRGGEPYFYRIIVNDGSVKYLQAFGKVECDDDGDPIRFIGAIQDTTEQYILQHKFFESKQLSNFFH